MIIYEIFFFLVFKVSGRNYYLYQQKRSDLHEDILIILF